MPVQKGEKRAKGKGPKELRAMAERLKASARSLEKVAGMMEAASIKTVDVDGLKGVNEGIKAIDRYHARASAKVTDAANDL